MAKKKKEDGGEPKPPGKAKAALVPVGIFLLGIIVGQKVLGGGGTTVVQAAGTETTVVETVETTVPEGETVSLGESTVTLADGHQLKFGLAVRLAPEEMVHEEEGAGAATEGSGHGETATTEAVVVDDSVGTEWLEALDLAVSVFGSHTMAELQSPEGRAEAKERLAEQLRAAYPDEVEEVFLNPFVMV